ncbi:MAG: class I SAM-dependent methyltransferase [Planctomycetes bacterium]|nr:class I SAM-dependent methyltransferase [Planctomycetota bacterium]
MALSRCLRGVKGIRTVCDTPCGPGRLFPYWRSWGFRIIGVDLSESMVRAADQMHHGLHAEGAILRDDAFHLGDILPQSAELVASIRFAYYFDREARGDLLRSFACASERYVLVEYKTRETLKGRIAEFRHKRKHGKSIKRFCNHRDILKEVEQAGLHCVRIVPIAEFSDRAFVLAEKPSGSQ